MFFILNLMLVAAAGLLILVVAATASIPGRVPTDPDAPDGEWVGPQRLSLRKPVKVRAPIRIARAARSAGLGVADLP